MFRRLILVRHAAPTIELDRPARLWRLSEAGRGGARALASRLKDSRIASVVSSVEPKAWETAAIVAQRLGCPCTAAPGLHEQERPDEPLAPPADLRRAVADLFGQPDEPVFGPETANQAVERFEGAVEAVLRDRAEPVAPAPDDALAIVTHGTVIALLLARWSGRDALELWARLGTPSFAVVALPSRQIDALIERID